MTWDIYIILGSFINGLNYCCHIVCYRTVQSLYVVALAWWPNKLKGHRSYPRNSSYARHCRGGLLNHTRRRELRVSCIYIHLGGICKEKHALLLSWLYRMWWFTAAKKGLHVPKKKTSPILHTSLPHSWSVIAAGTPPHFLFNLNPTVKLQAILAVLHGPVSTDWKNRLQLAWNWKCIVEQLPLWWWQYTSVAIGWSCCGCNWCCLVAASEVGGM